MIKEDYVSFETAKLLKEKGFDEICEYEYGVPDVDKGYVLQRFFKQVKNSELIDEAYTAPTLQMARKWLMDNKGFYIAVVPAGYEKVLFVEIYKFEFGEWNPLSDDDTSLVYTGNESIYDKEYERPEEAYNESIKYCLEKLVK